MNKILKLSLLLAILLQIALASSDQSPLGRLVAKRQVGCDPRLEYTGIPIFHLTIFKIFYIYTNKTKVCQIRCVLSFTDVMEPVFLYSVFKKYKITIKYI
jgi:hypothetical protein